MTVKFDPQDAAGTASLSISERIERSVSWGDRYGTRITIDGAGYIPTVNPKLGYNLYAVVFEKNIVHRLYASDGALLVDEILLWSGYLGNGESDKSFIDSLTDEEFIVDWNNLAGHGGFYGRLSRYRAKDEYGTEYLAEEYIVSVESATATCTKDPNRYTITVSHVPESAGTTSGGGRFHIGDTATISAIPSSGYSFVRWESSLGRSSNEPTYRLSVIGAEEWTAIFERSARFNVRIHVPTSITPTFSSADLYAGSAYQHVKSATVTKQSDGLYIAPFDIDSDVTSAIVYIKFDYTGNGEVSIHAVTSQSERVITFLLDRFGYINIQLSRAHIGDYVDVYFSFPPFLYVGRGMEEQDYIEVLENNSGEWYEIPWYRAEDTAIGISHPREVDRIAALKISVDQEEIDRQKRLRKIPVYKTSDGLVKLVNTTVHELNFYFSDTATYTENPPKIKNQSVFKPWNPWIVIDSIGEGLLFSTSNKQLLFANDKSLRCRTLEEI